MEHELVLEGPVVTLRPLQPTDADELASMTAASPTVEQELRWHTSALPVEAATARASIERLVADPAVQPFAVRGSERGELRGITSYYDRVPSVPRIETGHTQYARAFRGGATNPSAKLLLLRHAFDVWRCVWVALRCDAENTRSVGAIRRLGASHEGMLRNHRRRYDGTLADTAYFSITDAGWPGVRRGLERRLRT